MDTLTHTYTHTPQNKQKQSPETLQCFYRWLTWPLWACHIFQNTRGPRLLLLTAVNGPQILCGILYIYVHNNMYTRECVCMYLQIINIWYVYVCMDVNMYECEYVWMWISEGGYAYQRVHVIAATHACRDPSFITQQAHVLQILSYRMHGYCTFVCICKYMYICTYMYIYVQIFTHMYIYV